MSGYRERGSLRNELSVRTLQKLFRPDGLLGADRGKSEEVR
jgi:hypothetical protein